MKQKLYRTALCVCILLIATGCSDNESKLHQVRLVAFGTLVDISTWGADPGVAEQAIAAVEASFNTIHHTWHAWQPSTLTRINERLAKGEAVDVSPDNMQLIREGIRLSDASDSLFNPAIGSLIGLWGFHNDDPPQGPPPDDSAIKQLLAAAPSMDDLVIRGSTLSTTNPAVQLDFGGFAKGYAVDQAIGILRARGISNAIVNAGGDLRAIGSHGDRPWRIGVRHPREAGIIASLETSDDESVFTSGNYERFFDYQGVRYHHIIDPRNGYPARDFLSVTVIHDDATTADAAATALFVAGRALWRQIASQMGVSQVMIIDDQLTVLMTPEMARRIHFEVDPPPKVVISEPT